MSTFLELQNECLPTGVGNTARFKETQRSSVKKWINHRYAILWGMDDWTFKKTFNLAMTVTAGQATAGPTDLAIPISLFDNNGNEIIYVDPGTYLNCHVGNSSGTPDKYTVVNKTIYLDPTPASSSSAWAVYYEKTPWVSGNPTSGPPLVGDTDVPAIPAEYHYMLVPGATSVGSISMNDFTYQFAEQEWQNDLDAMRRIYLADVRAVTGQWGAQVWC